MILKTETQRINFTIEVEQEEDERWIAEVLELSGVLAYGETAKEAMTRAQALGLRVVADRIERNEETTAFTTISFAAA